MNALINWREIADAVARGEVPALSIKQPYPHHIFHDGKDVENRDWPTKRRGWFLVHAGISTSECNGMREREYPRGGIVGIARITDCVREMDSGWFFGRFGFVLADAHPLPLIPCRGALGFFKLGAQHNELAAQEVRKL